MFLLCDYRICCKYNGITLLDMVILKANREWFASQAGRPYFTVRGGKMEGKMKNIEKAKVLKLKQQVEYQQGQIVSKTLVQNESVSLTLFAFEKGEEISTHASGGDAMVTILDGTGKITIDGKEFILEYGDSIVMPAKIPHAVYGQERFKMLLTVVF